MNKKISLFYKLILIILLLSTSNFNRAEEILIYADSISYDEKVSRKKKIETLCTKNGMSLPLILFHSFLGLEKV